MTSRDLIRWLTPHGVVERHRRRFRLGQLGLPKDSGTLAAVDSCRYELWPDYLRRGSPPWTLVDVGANEGGFARAATRLVDLRSLHVFEPLPACHAILEQQFTGMNNVHFYRTAVGATPGHLDIHFTEDCKMSSVLKPRAAIANAYQTGAFIVQRKINVPVLTLDQALPTEDEIGLLKVDVQGYEMEVFRGAEAVLHRTRAILLEANYLQHYEGAATFDLLFEYLRTRGFRVFGISAPYSSGSSGPLWADAMFVKQQA